jgi:ATP/maltotriose-dependent transcriptional regulator MalT
VTLSLAAEECTGLVRAGHQEEARLIAARFGFEDLHSRNDAVNLIYDKAVRAAARYILLHSPALVIDALDAAIESCRRRELAHRLVELLLIRALARQQQPDRVGAETDLVEAMGIAAPRAYQRVFLDEGRPLFALIDRLDLERLSGSPAAPLARRLQRTVRKNDNPERHAVETRSEQLTRREVSILKRLESGLSNKEIAEAIFVSEGTLKWHLHNVYGKLDVKNRSGAISRAKEAGIL